MTIHTDTKPMTVLLAEDQLEVLKVHQLFLERMGHDVLTASNGQEAFSKFERNRNSIDLIVTDYNMPEWNGVELIRAVRHLDTEVPILVITGFAENHALQEAKIHGANIIRKPVRFATLAENIPSG